MQVRAPPANVHVGPDPRMTTDVFPRLKTNGETLRGAGRQPRVSSRRSPPSLPRSERLHLYQDESKETRDRKDKLLQDIKKFAADGNFRKLMPSKRIPSGYLRSTDVTLGRVSLHHPRDWNKTFLANLVTLIKAARCNREVFIPAMKGAVRGRTRNDSGELTSKDLKAALKML